MFICSSFFIIFSMQRSCAGTFVLAHGSMRLLEEQPSMGEFVGGPITELGAPVGLRASRVVRATRLPFIHQCPAPPAATAAGFRMNSASSAMPANRPVSTMNTSAKASTSACCRTKRESCFSAARSPSGICADSCCVRPASVSSAPWRGPRPRSRAAAGGADPCGR